MFEILVIQIFFKQVCLQVLKIEKVADFLKFIGKSFHILGPAILKDLEPWFFILQVGTFSSLCDVDLKNLEV